MSSSVPRGRTAQSGRVAGGGKTAQRNAIDDDVGIHRTTGLAAHLRSEADYAIFGRDLDHSTDYTKEDVQLSSGAAGGGGHGDPRHRIDNIDDSVGVHRKTALQPHLRTEVDKIIFGRDQDGSDAYGAVQGSRKVHGYAGPKPVPKPPRRIPIQDKWDPYIADGRLVHKTLPGTSGCGMKSRRLKRIGTNPNNAARDGDADEYDISNRPRARQPSVAYLPNHPLNEEHLGPGLTILSRPMPAWPGRPDTGLHEAPPAPSCLQRSMSTADIDGAAPKLQASRILGSSIRRHFRTTNEIDDIAGTRSLPKLRSLQLDQQQLLPGLSHGPRGHWRVGTVADMAGAAGGGGRGNPRGRIDAIDDNVGVQRKTALAPHLRSDADLAIFGRDLDASNQYSGE